MKKSVVIILFFLATIGITGCGEVDLGDTYVEGSDFQYMYLDEWNRLNQEKGENGYFFMMGHYIYYLDNKTQKLVPLCNKADCLHDRETDAGRYRECNAYIEMEQDFGDKISYCNGYLYYMGTETDADDYHDYSVLYRLKEDGSQKDEVHRWDKDVVSDWCLHRDVFYYVEHTFHAEKDAGEDSTIDENYAVKMFSVKDGGKPETIYEPEKGLSVYTVSWPKAYGNHFYFMIHAAATDNLEEITDENWMDYEYLKYWHYDIQTKELKELTLPQMQRGESISDIGFWKDRLIVEPYDSNKELDEKGKIYITGLDGNGTEILFEGVKQGLRYFTDGKYLYTSNSPLVAGGIEKEQYYQVYDENLKLLDTLGMPFETAGDIVAGQPEGTYLFLGREDGNGANLEYFDKNGIGSCKGDAFSLKKIAELDYSNAQISMDGE